MHAPNAIIHFQWAPTFSPLTKSSPTPCCRHAASIVPNSSAFVLNRYRNESNFISIFHPQHHHHRQLMPMPKFWSRAQPLSEKGAHAGWCLSHSLNLFLPNTRRSSHHPALRGWITLLDYPYFAFIFSLSPLLDRNDQHPSGSINSINDAIKNDYTQLMLFTFRPAPGRLCYICFDSSKQTFGPAPRGFGRRSFVRFGWEKSWHLGFWALREICVHTFTVLLRSDPDWKSKKRREKQIVQIWLKRYELG